jgi:hypothetical protein
MSLMLAALLLGATPTATQSTPVEPVAKPVKEKKICKEDPAYTGSRMKKKLCLTESEWNVRSQDKSAGDIKTISH